LIKLCEFSPNNKWTLLYRGTRDGFGADVFHSKCDDHPNTLTLLKASKIALKKCSKIKFFLFFSLKKFPGHMRTFIFRKY
jgi:hypothetical protein